MRWGTGAGSQAQGGFREHREREAFAPTRFGMPNTGSPYFNLNLAQFSMTRVGRRSAGVMGIPMFGRHARLFACMDLPVSRLEVCRKAPRVEQRRPRPIVFEPLPDVLEPAGAVGQLNGQIFVLRRSLRNEFGQVD